MEIPDLSNADFAAFFDWYRSDSATWLAVSADKNARWPVPSNLREKLPVSTGDNAVVIGKQRITDALHMSQVDPGAVLAELGLLLLQV